VRGQRKVKNPEELRVIVDNQYARHGYHPTAGAEYWQRHAVFGNRWPWG